VLVYIFELRLGVSRIVVGFGVRVCSAWMNYDGVCSCVVVGGGYLGVVGEV